MEHSDNWSNEALLTFAEVQSFNLDDFGFDPISDDLSKVFLNTEIHPSVEGLESGSESSSSSDSFLNESDNNIFSTVSFDSSGWTSTDHSFETTDFENIDFECLLGDISDEDFWQDKNVVNSNVPINDYEVKPPTNRKRKSPDVSQPSRKRRRNYIMEKLDEVVRLLRKHKVLGVVCVDKKVPKVSDTTSLLLQNCGSFINSFMSGDFNDDRTTTSNLVDDSICISVPSLLSLSSYFNQVEVKDFDNPLKSKGLVESSNDQDNSASRCDIIGVTSISLLSRQMKSSLTMLLQNHVNPNVTDSDFSLSAELANCECDVISSNLEKCSLRFLWKSSGLSKIGLTRELHVYGLVQFSRKLGLITSMFVSFDKATVLRQLKPLK